ncbi:MAG: hypothetical protein KF723_06145 [Rhizobiaceae bacterium]|nr:hypothetical protein [Rhizobiaceae bacterium]
MRMTTIATVLALAPSVALAGVLDIPATYGNAAGCAFAKDGSFDDDTLLMLSPDEYSAYATGCEFLQALKAKDGSFVITMLCSHEGETFQSVGFMRVKASTDVGDSYDMFDQHGELMGTLGRCP